MKRQSWCETTRLQLVTHWVPFRLQTGCGFDLRKHSVQCTERFSHSFVPFISLIDLGIEVLLGIRKDNLPSVSITSHQLSFQIVLLQKYFTFIEYS